MTGVLDLETHLGFYKSYHFNRVNVIIHTICIPIILTTIVTALTTINISDQHPFLNVGTAFTVAYGIYYTLLDTPVGLPVFSGLVYINYAIKEHYLSLDALQKSQFVKSALTLHVLAWLAQFYGHGVHEKRAPALLDNLLQALVLAPFFVVYELLFVLGIRKDLEKAMLNKAGVMRSKFASSK
ncbi:DUF962-domain-containing protein [Suhomyces tanzawaensis NRRL Y-17324]|uniref:DUF962-domain-containing protein n=1 Tax=Suhomyces tanzawaensis NRRL Y-17324 TaxID=984487 RepID=A0A1E4SD21_9ASCO|nr:DUF962-domain-containing protein [Suhomyces tanzawaensis NRRL Y-17324]ODV77282.1 DUF962-domain-containing protein [Suhomyces tanzawaensis NRRL Y-17324]